MNESMSERINLMMEGRKDGWWGEWMDGDRMDEKENE